MAITLEQQELLQKPFKGSYYLAILKPTVLWSAQLVGDHDKGSTTINFDNGVSVDGHFFSVIAPYQELYIGTANGLDDIGRVRLRSITSIDGTSGSLLISANSIEWTDNMYLTFVHDYKIRPRFSLLGNDGTFYKDTDIVYSDFNIKPNPICIAGSHMAGILNPTFVVQSKLPDSYSMLSGVTITNYGLSVYPATGVSVSLNASTGVGNITFTQPGDFWATYTVTDSNGKTTQAFRCYQIFNDVRKPISSFYIDNYRDSLSLNSKSMQITFHDDMSEIDIPNDTLAIAWCEPEQDIVSLHDQYFLMVGYTKKRNYSSQFDKGTASNQIEIISPDQVGSDIYSFSMVLKSVPDTPDTWWKYPNNLTPTRAIHHFIYLHSTILFLCDIIGLNNNTELVAAIELESGQKGTVLQMASDYLSTRSIRHYLSCDAGGRIIMLPHKQLLIDSQRNALPVYINVEDNDIARDIVITTTPTSTVVLSHVSGMQFTGTFEASGLPIVNPICAIAPSVIPQDRGSSVADMQYQVLSSQSQANQLAGRVLAAANIKIPEINIMFRGGYLFNLDTANNYVYTLTHITDDGQVFNERRIFLKSLSSTINVNTSVITTECVFEIDMPGIIGEATDCPQFPDIGGEYEETDPSTHGRGALITGGYNGVWRLGLQSGAWTQTTSQQTYTMHIDPFWQDIQQSDASNDAILWRGGQGYIKQSFDGGVTWSTITIPNPPNSFGDSPAPSNANTFNFYSSGSSLLQGTHCFLRSYAVTDTRYWLAVTRDDGATWEQEPIITSSALGYGFDFLIDNNGQYSEGSHGSYLGMQIKSAFELQPGKVLIAYTVNSTSTDLRVGIIKAGYDTAIVDFYQLVEEDVTEFTLTKRDSTSALLIYRENINNEPRARMLTVHNDNIELHSYVVLADYVFHPFTGRYSAAFITTDKVVAAMAMGGATDLGIGVVTFSIDNNNNIYGVNLTIMDTSNSVGYINVISLELQRSVIMYQYGGFTPSGMAYIKLYGFTIESNGTLGYDNVKMCSSIASYNGTLLGVAYISATDGDVSLLLFSNSLTFITDLEVYDTDPADTVTDVQLVYESSSRIIVVISVQDSLGDMTVHVIPVELAENFARLTGIDYVINMVEASHDMGANMLSCGRLMFAYSLNSNPHNLYGHILDIDNQYSEATSVACSLSEDNIAYVMTRFGCVWACQTWDIDSPLTLLDTIRIGGYVDGYNMYVSPSTQLQCYWAFGRCSEGHILFVNEDTQTLDIITDEWSNGYCTTLRDVEDNVYATYSNGTNNKFYLLVDGAFKLISTLTIKKSSFPLGTAYDWSNRRVCFVAQELSVPTVIYTPANYLRYVNITLNHPTTGARVIEVL